MGKLCGMTCNGIALCVAMATSCCVVSDVTRLWSSAWCFLLLCLTYSVRMVGSVAMWKPKTCSNRRVVLVPAGRRANCNVLNICTGHEVTNSYMTVYSFLYSLTYLHVRTITYMSFALQNLFIDKSAVATIPVNWPTK